MRRGRCQEWVSLHSSQPLKGPVPWYPWEWTHCRSLPVSPPQTGTDGDPARRKTGIRQTYAQTFSNHRPRPLRGGPQERPRLPG